MAVVDPGGGRPRADSQREPAVRLDPLPVAPIENVINHAGWRAAFLQFGIIQGIIVILAAMFLAAPPEGFKVTAVTRRVSKFVRQAVGDSTPAEMVRAPHFWVMYVMMV